MQINIYIDTLFLINFFMIYFIFWTVNKILKNKAKIKNMLLAAALASFFYILSILFIPFNKIFSFLIICFIIIFSIFIAFKPDNLKKFLRLFLFVNLVSFIFGGTFFSIYYYTNFFNVFNNFFNLTFNNFSFKLFIICVILSYIFIKLFLNLYNSIFIKKQSFYEIILYKNGKIVRLNALLDTGNSLKEPISKKPVLIAEFFAIEELLTNSLAQIFKDKKENNLNKLLNIEIENDIRFIPFKSIGKENGIMIGIKIDKLEIKAQNNIFIENAIVGISNFKISKNGIYNAILSPEMLNF